MSSDLFGAVLSWKGLIVAMLAFGFAPGVFLRLIVLAFHRDDPRRDELLAELRVVPFIERPVWVAQQLEVALFEGLWDRAFAWAAGRVFWRWRLESGVESHRRSPETFWIPDNDEKALIRPGCHVKLMFLSTDNWRERMWIEVTKVGRRRLVGRVANAPIGVVGLEWDQKVRFGLGDVIDIDWELDVESRLDPCIAPEHTELDEP